MRCIVAALCLLLNACIVHELQIDSIEPVAADEPIVIESPVKAHLKDGSTVVFAKGVRVEKDTVYGEGRIYDMTLDGGTVIKAVPVDDIAAMESYQTPVNTAATTMGSAAGATAGTLAALSGVMLLFGSCPTVYSFEGSEALLEAETFSYSIAPSYQSRDIDRLGLTPRDGVLELEVRNEMLETHYIDQLEILEVLHRPGERAIPDQKGRALVFGRSLRPARAIDQYGDDIAATIETADDHAWRAADARLRAVLPDDYHDHLDFEFDVPDGAGELAVVLRLRNSLLSTVLLYDIMLSEQGFGALDWMGSDLQRFGTWRDLGLWYAQEMGLRISVWDGRRYREIGRVPDQGPIAWSERAVRLPATGRLDDGKLKVRLSFVADNWRIDQVALATGVRRVRARVLGVDHVTGADGDRPDVAAFLDSADKQYLISRPQDRLRLRFDAGATPDGIERSFFLASEGYYIEWMRADWLKEQKTAAFVPGRDALLRALEIWGAVRADYRRQFEASKVAVR